MDILIDLLVILCFGTWLAGWLVIGGALGLALMGGRMIYYAFSKRGPKC